MMTDPLHVVHARAAGLDVHKMQITASVRLCTPGAGEPYRVMISLVDDVLFFHA